MRFNDLVSKSRQPIRHDLRGAPFRIAERVRVVESKDETFDRHYRGRIGTVSYFEYDCGCGQRYPNDPMIGVIFRDGRTEEFWKEELVHLGNRAARKSNRRGRSRPR